MRLLFAIALAATPVIAADDAPSHTLTVVNDTSAPVNQLFVGGGGKHGLKAKVDGLFGNRRDESAQDRLGAKLLPRGGSIVVELAGERCRYDLSAVLEDGRTYVAAGYDVCARPRWSIASGSLAG